VAAAVVLALVGMPFGNSNPDAFAHSPCDDASCSVQPQHLHIDAIPDNGTRPCVPIDDEATVAVDNPHEVAVCLEDYTAHGVAGFDLFMTNTQNLNFAPDPQGAEELANGGAGPDCTADKCVNDNPDINDGNDDVTGLKLGSNWDCTGGGNVRPRSETLPIRVTCLEDTISPDHDLTANPGLLATISFDAVGTGNDVVSFTPLALIVPSDVTGARQGSCGDVPDDLIGCFGATIHKVPDLSLTKSVVGSPVAGGPVDFLVTTTGTATSVVVWDDLDNSVAYDDGATDTANGGNVCDPVTNPTPGGPIPNAPTIPGGDSTYPEVVCGDDLGLWSAGTLNLASPDSVDIIADVPLSLAGKSVDNAAMLWPEDPNMENNVDTATADIADANVTINKTPDAATKSEGASITWLVVANSTGASPASNVVITDTVDANQSITSAVLTGASATAYDCAESGGNAFGGVTPTVTCTLDDGSGPALTAVSGTVTATVVTLVTGSAGNQCANTITAGWADPTVTVVCLPPTVRMEKDVDTDATTIIDATNLFLRKDAEGHFIPLVIYEIVSNPGNDPDGVGAFEFDLKYDNHIFDISIVPTDWLVRGYDNIRYTADDRTQSCAVTIINENDIRFGCVSTGPTPGQVTAGVAAIITLTPDADLINRLTPGQKNGVFSPILDEGCELADVLGDPLALVAGAQAPLAPGVLPGGQIAVCTDMGITVRILEGDLNLDCVVDALDQQAISFRYGSVFGNLYYQSWYDLEPWNKDYDIDIKDIQKVWGRQGSTCVNPVPDQDPLPLPDP